MRISWACRREECRREKVNLEPITVGIGFVYNSAINTYTYCYKKIVTAIGEGIEVGSCAGTN
jgi:hypothetical protein